MGGKRFEQIEEDRERLFNLSKGRKRAPRIAIGNCVGRNGIAMEIDHHPFIAVLRLDHPLRWLTLQEYDTLNEALGSPRKAKCWPTTITCESCSRIKIEELLT